MIYSQGGTPYSLNKVNNNVFGGNKRRLFSNYRNEGSPKSTRKSGGWANNQNRSIERSYISERQSIDLYEPSVNHMTTIDSTNTNNKHEH